jgi:hypothetical protein
MQAFTKVGLEALLTPDNCVLVMIDHQPFQNIDGNDLAQFKDVRTQAVVAPPNLASGTLVYPYAKAKRRI